MAAHHNHQHCATFLRVDGRCIEQGRANRRSRFGRGNRVIINRTYRPAGVVHGRRMLDERHHKANHDTSILRYQRDCVVVVQPLFEKKRRLFGLIIMGDPPKKLVSSWHIPHVWLPPAPALLRDQPWLPSECSLR